MDAPGLPGWFVDSHSFYLYISELNIEDVGCEDVMFINVYLIFSDLLNIYNNKLFCVFYHFETMSSFRRVGASPWVSAASSLGRLRWKDFLPHIWQLAYSLCERFVEPRWQISRSSAMAIRYYYTHNISDECITLPCVSSNETVLLAPCPSLCEPSRR